EISNHSSKSIVSSAQRGYSQLPQSSPNHCVEGPLESTADSPGQLDYREMMSSKCPGLINLGYGEGMEPTRLLSDSIDCIFCFNAIADVGSSTCQCGRDSNFRENTDQRFLEMFD
ncbi:hypothetical protein KI387_002958, partial [Taxus chinensis]